MSTLDITETLVSTYPSSIGITYSGGSSGAIFVREFLNDKWTSAYIVLTPEQFKEIRDMLNTDFPDAILSARADGFDEGYGAGLDA